MKKIILVLTFTLCSGAGFADPADDADKAVFVGNSIAKEMYAEWPKFRKEECGNKDTPNCRAKHTELLHARWGTEYPLANVGGVVQHCKLHKEDCVMPWDTEYLLRQSHNFNAMDGRNQALANAASRPAPNWGALQGGFVAPPPQKVKCVHRKGINSDIISECR